MRLALSEAWHLCGNGGNEVAPSMAAAIINAGINNSIHYRNWHRGMKMHRVSSISIKHL